MKSSGRSQVAALLHARAYEWLKVGLLSVDVGKQQATRKGSARHALAIVGFDLPRTSGLSFDPFREDGLDD